MNKCQQCNKEFKIEDSNADDVRRFCQYLCEEVYMDEVEEELGN